MCFSSSICDRMLSSVNEIDAPSELKMLNSRGVSPVESSTGASPGVSPWLIKIARDKDFQSERKRKYALTVPVVILRICIAKKYENIDCSNRVSKESEAHRGLTNTLYSLSDNNSCGLSLQAKIEGNTAYSSQRNSDQPTSTEGYFCGERVSSLSTK